MPDSALLKLIESTPPPPIDDMLSCPCKTDEDAEIMALYISRHYSPKEIDEGVKRMLKPLPLQNEIVEDLPFIEVKVNAVSATKR